VFKTLFARAGTFFWYLSLGMLLLAVWLVLKDFSLAPVAIGMAVGGVLAMGVSLPCRETRVEISEHGIAGHGLLRVPPIGWSEVSSLNVTRSRGLNYVVVGSYSAAGGFRLGPFTRGDVQRITAIWESRPD
jgi:hypothetical protein